MAWRSDLASAQIILLAGVLSGCQSASAPGVDDLRDGTEVQQGELSARQRNCYTCHQDDANNDPTAILSGQLYARPGTLTYGSNLTPDGDTGLGGWSAASIVRALRSGIDVQGDELCPVMPRWPDLSDAEAGALVAYLQSLRPVRHQIPRSLCPPIKPAEDAGISDGSADQ